MNIEADIEKELRKVTTEFKERKDIKSYIKIKQDAPTANDAQITKGMLDISPKVNQEKK